MTENRNGFLVEAELRQVSGLVEREAAAAMIVRHSPGAQRITDGADKASIRPTSSLTCARSNVTGARQDRPAELRYNIRRLVTLERMAAA